MDVGLHRHEHALHIGTLNDRGHAVAAFSATALPALAGIGERLLIGAIADGYPLRADSQPGGVHHHKHGGEAAVLLAHQPGFCALVITVDHDAGRGAVDAELVLDSGAAQVVGLAERSIRVDEELRREEQRKAACPRRRAGEPGENEVHDVLGHVVFAIGDENLLAKEAAGPILGAFRPGSHGIEVRPRLGLGPVHGAAPPPADHWREIDVREFARAVRLQGTDGALGQERAEREGHRGAVPDFCAGDVDEMGQAHAAELGRRGDAVPARLRPVPVDVGEAGGCCHPPVFISRSRKIAGAVEGRDFCGGEAAGFPDNRGYSVPIEVPHEPLFDERRKIGDRAQRKKDVGGWRTIRHLLAPPYRERAGLIGSRPTGSRHWASYLPRQGQKSLCTVEFARNASREERWRSTGKSPALQSQALRQSRPRPHAFALEALSLCRLRLCTALQRTRLPTRRLPRSTPPRSGQRSTRSYPMCWISMPRASTPSSARRPKHWPARSGPGLSRWIVPWLQPPGSACWRARALTLLQFARRRTKRLARSSPPPGSLSRPLRPTDPAPRAQPSPLMSSAISRGVSTGSSMEGRGAMASSRRLSPV